MRREIHVVSHGPHCLDGVAAAAAVARAFAPEAEVVAHFANNPEIDRVLRAVEPTPGREAELWITDISWREADTDAHLRALAARGVAIVWIDHHRTALERARAGKVDVPFTATVLSEDFAASRLVYEFLERRFVEAGREPPPAFAEFAPVVAMADDNDRWLHRIPGSRELGLVVRALGAEAYPEFLALDGRVTYTPRMAAARERVAAELQRTFAIATASRVERRCGPVTLVAAVCDGHPSEIGDAWGREISNAVFALYDASTLTVSFRRSPDCRVDLSRLAEAFGGGGHPAASGCELADLRRDVAGLLADRVATRLA